MEKNVQSFGIIPIFLDKNNFKILVVKNKKSGQWGLPKGTPEINEQPLQTAKRELFEETKIIADNVEIEPTFSENYSFEIIGTKYNKTVVYYIYFTDKMIANNNSEEIEQTKWVSFKEAIETLKFDSLKNIIDELEKYLINNK